MELSFDSIIVAGFGPPPLFASDNVTVVEFDQEKPRRTSDREEAPKPAPTQTSLGVAVSDITEARRRDLKVKGGVKVDSVEGAAARAGIREGDIVMAIDNTEVSNAKQFEQLVAKVDRTKPVTLLVRRGESANFIIVRPVRAN